MEDTDAQGQPFWPELQEIARTAREHRRLAPDTRSQIIVRLCTRAPLSVRELSILLDRSEAYIGDAIRPLVNSGELTFLYPDQPRHPRQKYRSDGGVSSEAGTDYAQLDFPPTDFPETRLWDRSAEGATLEGGREVASEPAAPAIPNHWTNLVVAAVVGFVLAVSGVGLWFLIALACAVLLSWWHVSVGSAQFRRFSALNFITDRRAGFLLLKSAVTVAEIAVVYLAIRAVSRGE